MISLRQSLSLAPLMASFTKPETKNSAVPAPFRFFDLPRELRNRIYSMSTRCVATDGLSTGLRIEINAGLWTNMLVVSNQFRLEYAEEAVRNAEAVLQSRWSESITPTRILEDLPLAYHSNLRKLSLRVDIEERRDNDSLYQRLTAKCS